MRNSFADILGAYERPCRIEASQCFYPTEPGQPWQRLYLQSGNLPIRHISHCFAGSFDEIDVRRDPATQFNHCLHWHDTIPAQAWELVALLAKRVGAANE